MKKLLTIIMIACLSISLTAQMKTIEKPNTAKALAEKLTLSSPCDSLYNVIKNDTTPYEINKPLKSPMPRHLTSTPKAKQNPFLTTKDTSFVKKDSVGNGIRNYIIINNNIATPNNQEQQEGQGYGYHKHNYNDMLELKLLGLESTRNSKKGLGWLKIGSGILLQGIGVGVDAYVNTPTYTYVPVTTIHEVKYTYPVYQIITTPPTVNTTTTTSNSTGMVAASTRNFACQDDRPFIHHKPIHHPPVIPPVNNTNTNNNNNTNINNNNSSVTVNNTITITMPNITLVSHTETGTAYFTETHQVAIREDRNKTVGYVIAGVLCLAGVGLETWGIIDIHNANVSFNHGIAELGYSFNF